MHPKNCKCWCCMTLEDWARMYHFEAFRKDADREVLKQLSRDHAFSRQGRRPPKIHALPRLRPVR